MRHLIIICLTILLNFTNYSNSVYASDLCEEIKNNTINVHIIKNGSVLSKENWKSIDVLVNLDFDKCHASIEQELIRAGDGANSTQLWQFYSTSNAGCDGENAIGVIYSYDLKTPIAHIFDGDIYCKADWSENNRAINHKCDDVVQKFVKDNMESSLGFDFESTSVPSIIRYKGIGEKYSTLRLYGNIKNKKNRFVQVEVTVQLDDCHISSAYIDRLRIGNFPKKL